MAGRYLAPLMFSLITMPLMKHVHLKLQGTKRNQVEFKAFVHVDDVDDVT